MLEFIVGAALGGLVGAASSGDTQYVPVGPSHVDVHEHRAPTDESIRLLKEMEEKAMSKMLGAFVTKSNDLVGAVIYTQKNPLAKSYIIYVMFKLNGQNYEFKFNTSGRLDKLMTEKEARRMLSGKIADVITNNLSRETI